MDYGYQAPLDERATIRAKVIDFIQTLVVFASILIVVYLFIAQPHRVSGNSMFPTLHNGDYIITNKISYRLNQSQKEDIVVFKNPRDQSQDFIKRIMATPQDTIKIEKHKVYVNGQLIDEPYLNASVATNASLFLEEGEEVRVPEGRYIVFGDNRTASSDSREWGFITKEEIIGKALFRYWPLSALGLIRH